MLLLCAVFLMVHCVYSCGNITVVVLENNLLALASLKHVTSIDVRTLQALDVINVITKFFFGLIDAGEFRGQSC